MSVPSRFPAATVVRLQCANIRMPFLPCTRAFPFRAAVPVLNQAPLAWSTAMRDLNP